MELKDVREKQMLARSGYLRAHGGYIPAAAFRERRHFFAAKVMSYSLFLPLNIANIIHHFVLLWSIFVTNSYRRTRSLCRLLTSCLDAARSQRIPGRCCWS